MKKIVALLVLGVIMISVMAQDGFTSMDLFKIQQVAASVLSPNGKMIAYTITVPRPWTDKPGGDYRELRLLNLATGEDRLFRGGKISLSGLAWTPDSKKITFVMKGDEDKHRQVYAMPVNGGEAQVVTQAKVSIISYRWNPEGGSIAYLAVETDESRKDLEKKGFNAEVFEEDPPDRNLYIYDLKTDTNRQLTHKISVFSISWNPAGTIIAAQMAPYNLVDYSYMFKKIYLVDVASGNSKLLVHNEGKLSGMKWSPDGAHLAFIGGIDINDPVSGSLFVVDAKARTPYAMKDLMNYRLDCECSVKHVEWKDNTTMVYSTDESVDVVLNEQKLNAATSKVLLEGGTLVFSSFGLVGSKIVFSGSNMRHAGELFTFDLRQKRLKKHTNLSAWMVNKKFGIQERITYKSRDNLKMEGVLIYPNDYQKGTLYPLIVYVHGGPESCVKNGWATYYSMWGQVASAKGYFVFMPNYRGSSGRGVAFSQMNQGDLGDEEFNDVLDGIDYLDKAGMIDKSKVGIGGGSYGGYFAAWGATKHSEHFAAAVVFVGISDQLSKRYTTDIPYESYNSHWKFWPHENRDLVIDRSPITYAENNKTATLILHGKDDPRVHPSQSLMLYRALKLPKKAPVRLIWYPGEGHGNRKNPARLDYNMRTLAWFDYYLKSDNNKSQMPPKYLEYPID